MRDTLIKCWNHC